MTTLRHHVKVLFPAIAAMAIAGVVIADLNGYMSAPGEVGAIPESWPAPLVEADPRLTPASGGWTFVLTAHPGCPCTRATAEQLIEALRGAGTDDRLIVLVRTSESERVPDSGPIPDLGVLEPLKRLPIARFVPDPGAKTSAAFGGLTSGFLVAFDPSGETAFSGGLTPRRGMVGPAPGVEAIERLIKRDAPRTDTTEVYGCPLCDSGAD